MFSSMFNYNTGSGYCPSKPWLCGPRTLSTSDSFDRRYRPPWANEIGFCFTPASLLFSCSFCILLSCHPDCSLEQTKQLLKRHADSTCLDTESKQGRVTIVSPRTTGCSGVPILETAQRKASKDETHLNIHYDHFLINTNIPFSSWILWLLSIQCNTVRTQSKTSLIRRIPFWYCG